MAPRTWYLALLVALFPMLLTPRGVQAVCFCWQAESGLLHGATGQHAAPSSQLEFDGAQQAHDALHEVLTLSDVELDASCSCCRHAQDRVRGPLPIELPSFDLPPCPGCHVFSGGYDGLDRNKNEAIERTTLSTVLVCVIDWRVESAPSGHRFDAVIEGVRVPCRSSGGMPLRV